MTELQVILKRIAEDRQRYEQSLLRGDAKDFADYRHLAGVVQGLTRAENHVKDLVQKLENSDE